jgi:hypothetical protein
MPYPVLDRSRLAFKSVRERESKSEFARIAVDPDAPPAPLPGDDSWLAPTVDRILEARGQGRPVALAYGAHLIKNGLGPVVSRLMEKGFITLAATNGAGCIHDWEFAYFGRSEEDVRRYAREGQFGIWEETGFAVNAAALAGALGGMGLGEAVGALINRNGLEIPSRDAIQARLRALAGGGACAEEDRALLEALFAIENLNLREGWIDVPHAHPANSAQATAQRLGVPLCVMPGIGQDIVHTHPLSQGGALGLASMRDFVTYAHEISRFEGGVYLSVGSAIQSPMIFEKSLSMARNLAHQAGRRIEHFDTIINDIQPGVWDWSAQGEPPKSHPAYFLRFCKTFARMGGAVRYVCLDNRAFLTNILARLMERKPEGFAGG